MQTTLLVVDDEPKVLQVIQPFLEQEGYRVCTARTGLEALDAVKQYKPELVVLDWMLPELSGLEVCQRLRQHSNIGIIMVTARADELDRVVGLEVGADDYIVKPFSLRELSARIRSILRRMQQASGGEAPAEPLVRGDFTIDESKFRVWKRNVEITLTPTEFQILCILAAKPGVVYSRLQLLQLTMGETYLNYERTIDSHMSHLRKKIEDDPANPRHVQTIYGIGYRFGDET